MEIIYKGDSIAGGGLSVLSMTKAEYLANQEVYDASDNIIEITDDDDLAISGEQIAFDNTGTGLTSDDVDGAIKEINTRVSVHNNSSSQAVTLNPSTDFPYTCPKDGYLVIKSGDSAGNQTGAYLNGIVPLQVETIRTNYNLRNIVFVRKGTVITQLVLSGNGGFYFYPLS